MQSQKLQNDLCSFPRQDIQYHIIQVYPPTTNAEETEVEWFYRDLQNLIELTPKKMSFSSIRNWNTKVESQEIPGVTGNFGLGVKNEAGQRLTESRQENALVIANTLFQQHRDNSTRGQNQMINTEIRLIIFFAAEDGKALWSQQNQDQELTVAQITNSFLKIQT